jgi:hypothetical protein
MLPGLRQLLLAAASVLSCALRVNQPEVSFRYERGMACAQSCVRKIIKKYSHYIRFEIMPLVPEEA